MSWWWLGIEGFGSHYGVIKQEIVGELRWRSNQRRSEALKG